MLNLHRKSWIKEQSWKLLPIKLIWFFTVCQSTCLHVTRMKRVYYMPFFLTLFRFYNLFWYLIPKSCGNVRRNVMFLDVTSSCFFALVPCLKFTLRKVAAKQVTDVSLVLKDSDTESENLSSLIRLSVSDGQKTDSLNIVSFIGI